MPGRKRQRGMGRPSTPRSHDGNQSGAGSGGNFVVPGILRTTQGPDLYPTPVLFETMTGRRSGTEVVQDRFFTFRPAAVVWGFLGYNWNFDLSTTTGNPSDATILPLSTLIDQLYGFVARIYENNNQRWINTAALANGAPAPFSMRNYLAFYCQAFSIIRACEGALNAADFNQVTANIANAVNVNLATLQGASTKLKTFIMPQGLIDLLDKMCGVKSIDKDSVPLYLGFQNANAENSPGDLTLPATIATQLSQANSFLNSLITPSQANQVPDFAAITNLFAQAYPRPTFKQKVVDQSFSSYDQVWQAAFAWRDTTSGNTFVHPNAGTNANLVPVFIRKGSTAEDTKYMQQLLRTAVFSNDVAVVTAANTSNTIGLYINSAANPALGAGSFGAYSQNGTFFNLSQTGAALAATSFGNFELEMNIWAAASRAETTYATAWSTDHRQFRDYDIVYVGRDVFQDETLYAIEKIFLEPVRARVMR